MGNISLNSKYQCCVSDSNFYEEDENTLEESTMQQNSDEIVVKK